MSSSVKNSNPRMMSQIGVNSGRFKMSDSDNH